MDPTLLSSLHSHHSTDENVLLRGKQAAEGLLRNAFLLGPLELIPAHRFARLRVDRPA